MKGKTVSQCFSICNATMLKRTQNSSFITPSSMIGLSSQVETLKSIASIIEKGQIFNKSMALRNQVRNFHTPARTSLSHSTLQFNRIHKLENGQRVNSMIGNGSLKRYFTPYNFHDAGYDDVWPVSKTNTILNVCAQGERCVVERFGKLLAIQDSGWFIAIPLIDQIAYVIDMRERAMAITPQSAITKDNVSVDVSGNLYFQFVDPEKAAYGSFNPLYAIRQCAQSAMRSAIGELELDEILHARAKLNDMIRGSVQGACVSWGLEVKRYEITEIKPDRTITIAMDKQAAAERNRREMVIQAEGEKRSQELSSEGMKLKMKNESEGLLIQVENEAMAQKRRYILEAEGEAESIMKKAEAYANSIALIGEKLGTEKGTNAAQLQLAKEYIAMYGQMGSQSNTMIFSDKPGDFNSLVAQASAVLQQSGSNLKPNMAPGNAGSPLDPTVIDEIKSRINK